MKVLCSYGIKEDSWLAAHLDKDAFILDVSRQWIEAISDSGSLEKKLFLELLSRKVFIHTKIDTLNVEAVKLLESYGFNVIDTNITFEKNIINDKKEIAAKVRITRQEDLDSVVSIAETNFFYSRFHLDPDIAKTTANEIKAQWVKAYFKKQRGDQMLVVQISSNVVGFILLLFKDGVIVIDLIAIDKKYRGKGLGGDLIKATEAMYSNKNKIIAGTQIANISSIRLYEKSGFKLSGSKYVLHYQSR